MRNVACGNSGILSRRRCHQSSVVPCTADSCSDGFKFSFAYFSFCYKEQRVNIARAFHDWVRECHENHDKQVNVFFFVSNMYLVHVS